MPDAATPRGGVDDRVAKRSRGTKKQDIEIATLKYGLWYRVADTVKIAVWIAATWIPLTAVTEMAKAIAGKKTEFLANVGLTASVAVNVLVSVGWGYTAWRSRKRKDEIDRLRKRTDELEKASLAGLENRVAEGT